MSSSWIVTLEEDDKDLILPLPQVLLNELGWEEGDMLRWKPSDGDKWILEKVVDDEHNATED
jgi:hypothetical protein